VIAFCGRERALSLSKGERESAAIILSEAKDLQEIFSGNAAEELKSYAT
jgi:hypothetical protein